MKIVEKKRLYRYVNIRTKEVGWFEYSYAEGLPVGGPDDDEGTPLWQPYPEEQP